MSDNRTRHFHAGKLRKTIGDTVYVSIAESGDTLYVASDGTFTSASRGWIPARGNLEAEKALGLTQQAICHALNGRTRSCGGFTWIYC